MPKEIKLFEMSMEEIEKKYGVKAKPGKLTNAQGKFSLEFGGKEMALDPGSIISPQPLTELVVESAEVRVIDTRYGPIVIIVTPPKAGPIHCYIILCYKPIPDLRIKIDRVMRSQLIKELVKERILTPALGKKLEIGIRQRIRG